MICKECRRANEPGEDGMHAFCKGGTWCDCQHQTGTYVNREAIERGKKQ